MARFLNAQGPSASATLDRIDEIVPPGTELHVSSPWHPDVLGNPAARQRAASERAAAEEAQAVA